MKQEFITTKGKAIVERDVLYLKNLDPKFHDTVLYEFIVPIFWIFAALAKLASADRNFDYFFSQCIFHYDLRQ